MGARPPDEIPVRGFAADANAEPAKDPDDDRVVDLDREEFPDVSPRVIRLADDICSSPSWKCTT